MRSILFVCTANICRSPTAEGVMRRILAREGLEAKVEVASAGTHDYHVGKPPFPMAVEMAKKRGYDITAHVARRIVQGDFEQYDMILGMDRSNVANLRTIVPTRSRQKIELLLEYGERFHDEDVPDPYTGDEKAFEVAFDRIEDRCLGLAVLMKQIAR